MIVNLHNQCSYDYNDDYNDKASDAVDEILFINENSFSLFEFGSSSVISEMLMTSEFSVRITG